ncbi:MAG: hypothetical protein EOO28_06560 [Comamonadaceae bacterium]|nr:MAG: hypothetical protein EOO28_06560 [Comamonadaceae bacterium]
MKNLSNWRSIRLVESRLQHDLRQRHSFRLHGMCIGLVTLALTWGVSHVQMRLGVDSLAVRYLVSLGIGYLGYLLMLRIWAGALVDRPNRNGPGENSGNADLFDIADLAQAWPSGGPRGASVMPDLKSGGGGDFAGGGASGDFSGPGDVPWLPETVGDGVGGLASEALDAAASADEGAIVVVPVAIIFLLGCAVFLGAGTLLLLYFGWEALLAVAVELAFSYVTARSAVRIVREGWLSAVLRLTWKPLLGTVICAFILGAGLDYFVPAADSLPHAIRLLRAGQS